jgi:hypothetical protein
VRSIDCGARDSQDVEFASQCADDTPVGIESTQLTMRAAALRDASRRDARGELAQLGILREVKDPSSLTL